MDDYDYDYDYILQKMLDYDYDYRNCCNRLQSITIVIVISPKPGRTVKTHKMSINQYRLNRIVVNKKLQLFKKNTKQL